MSTYETKEIVERVILLGVDVGDRDFLPFQDIEESVREDMELLKASPLIPEDVVISGAVYDVDTGLISEVK